MVVPPDAVLDSGFLARRIHPGGGHLALLGRRVGWSDTIALAACGQSFTGAEAVDRGLAYAAAPEDELDGLIAGLTAPAAADPELTRRIMISARLELGPPAVSWSSALEIERGAQMWSMSRKGQSMVVARAGAMTDTESETVAAAEDTQLRELRGRVRAFLRTELDAGAFEPAADSWMTGFDPGFSRRIGDNGRLGMAIPTRYGGHGHSPVERFVVTEELLAHGAPVAAHWVADRQMAPSILAHGTEEQKQRYLPGIARGELVFAIGMSEPDAGSDLAAVRTRAVEQVDGSWTLTGTKVWTTGAHLAHAPKAPASCWTGRCPASSTAARPTC